MIEIFYTFGIGLLVGFVFGRISKAKPNRNAAWWQKGGL